MYDPVKKSVTILSSTLAAGAVTGAAFYPARVPIGFLASQVGTGAQTATVIIEATSLPGVATSWLTIGTITLSGTTTAQDGFTTSAGFPAWRARITAITGTAAVITIVMSV